MEVSNPEYYLILSNYCYQATVWLTSFVCLVQEQDPCAHSLESVTWHRTRKLHHQKAGPSCASNVLSAWHSQITFLSRDAKPNKFIFNKNPTLISFLMLTAPDDKRSLNRTYISISTSTCIYQSTFLPWFSPVPTAPPCQSQEHTLFSECPLCQLSQVTA